MFFNKDKKVSLFPYTSELLHGLTPQSTQFYGWEIIKFDIPDCWKETQGKGVKVAVLDSGCDYNHSDLKGNMLIGKNFIPEEKDQPPMDRNSHGTHVAGTIAARNNRVGMVGVAPECKIMPVKVLGDNGSGSLLTVAEGIRWAADQRVDFITMSLGSVGTHRILSDAIDYAESKGVVCFCAAGNSGAKTDILYPAKYDNVIAIGAIDEFFNRTVFSCAGNSLDFLAPGQDIISCVPNNQYASMSGTSMSNPFATGCAALLLAWNKKTNRFKLNNAKDYIDVFKQHATPLRDERHQSIKYQGHGIIDITKVIGTETFIENL